MFFSESETAELKSIYVDDVKKEIVAFANTHGGTLYIGVEDNGTVCGVENTDAVIQRIMNTARDSIKPDVTLFMHTETIIVDGKNVVAVEVQCGAHRPYYLGAKGLRPEGVYVRQGTSSVPASDTAIRQMIKETDGDNYEDMRSLEQELTFEKLTAEFTKRGLQLGESQMKTLGLIDRDGLYSNLALLLSDQCPHIIKAATFAGTNQENFQDRREFTGSLLKQLEDAYAYLDMRNKNSATFEGLLRIDHKDYPDTAIRESLLNAIIHRDYAVSASTLLSVYSDRIELISVGGLAGGISYDDMMLGVSFCRNAKLANIFYRMDLIEAYGTGMKKIMSSYDGFTVKPEVTVSSGAFKFMLPSQTAVPQVAVTPQTKTKSKEAEKREAIVLSILSDRQPHPRAEIEKALGVSTSTTRRVLQKLMDDGKIATNDGARKNALYTISRKENHALRRKSRSLM